MVAPLALMGLSAAADIAGNIAGNIVGGLKKSSGSAQSAAAAKAALAGASPSKDKLKKTSQDFEKMFLEHALDRLTEAGGQEGPLGEAGTGGSVYRSMLAKEYAGSISQSGGVGISSQIYRQMLQLQESANRGG